MKSFLESDASQKWISWLGLFSSTGTLICCALPALLVSLGLGAALAGLVTAVPQLIWLSENKTLVFGLSGALILASGILQYALRNAPCPIDPKLRQACLSGRAFSRRILLVSGAIYGVGAYFAFFAT